MLDATEVMTGLYVGSRPLDPEAVHKAGIGTVLLLASEYQPSDVPGRYRGIEVVTYPFEDAVPTAHDRAMARSLGQFVARRLLAGQKVLSTCYMGHNRSAWVAAHAMVDTGVPPTVAVRRIQSRREHSLTNRDFVRDIYSREV